MIYIISLCYWAFLLVVFSLHKSHKIWQNMKFSDNIFKWMLFRSLLFYILLDFPSRSVFEIVFSIPFGTYTKHCKLIHLCTRLISATFAYILRQLKTNYCKNELFQLYVTIQNKTQEIVLHAISLHWENTSTDSREKEVYTMFHM